MMISPMIHKMLRREDLRRLVTEIASTDPAEAYPAAKALESGMVHTLLDSPIALEAVRGRGGAPAPLPLALLWYVPIRAALCARGERDIDLADYTASLALVFLPSRANRQVAHGENTIAAWKRSLDALPADSVARGERAGYCGSLALWWAGLFPQWVARGAHGPGMIAAYVDFAAGALAVAARTLQRTAPNIAGVYAAAAGRAALLREALDEAGRDYLGREAHTASARLERYLARLKPATQPNDLSG